MVKSSEKSDLLSLINKMKNQNIKAETKRRTPMSPPSVIRLKEIYYCQSVDGIASVLVRSLSRERAPCDVDPNEVVAVAELCTATVDVVGVRVVRRHDAFRIIALRSIDTFSSREKPIKSLRVMIPTTLRTFRRAVQAAQPCQ